MSKVHIHAEWFPRAGVVVAETIREALSHRVDSMSQKLHWFYGQVRNGGPWDVKQQMPYYQDFGNFHYGAVGTALGLSRSLLLRAAGFAQKRAGTSHDEWGHYLDWESNYGDDPADRSMIDLGISFYQAVRSSFEKVNLEDSTTYSVPVFLIETLHGAKDTLRSRSDATVYVETIFPQ